MTRNEVKYSPPSVPLFFLLVLVTCIFSSFPAPWNAFGLVGTRSNLFFFGGWDGRTHPPRFPPGTVYVQVSTFFATLSSVLRSHYGRDEDSGLLSSFSPRVFTVLDFPAEL